VLVGFIDENIGRQCVIVELTQLLAAFVQRRCPIAPLWYG